MIYSKELISRIKKEIDIVKLIKEYIPDLTLHNKIWIGTCPKHDDKTPSFRIWELNQSWACFSCHSGKKDKNDQIFGSDCIAFYQWINNKSFAQTIRELADKVGIIIENDHNQTLYRAEKNKAIAYNANLISKKKEYLYRRGLSDEDIKKWLIGFTGTRYSFPLLDIFDRVIGFTNRIQEDQMGAKYINSKTSAIFNKSKYFYGINYIDTSFKEIRITEGVFDVILAHKYNVKNIVACLSTSFTEDHIQYIKKEKFIPVFILDGDAAGIKATNKHVELLSKENIFSKIVILPKDKDLADLALKYKNNLEDYINDNSIAYHFYFLKNIIAKYESRLIEEQLKIYPEIKSIYANITNLDEKKILSDFILNKTGIKLERTGI